MRYRVIDGFNSHTRRFVPEMEVAAEEIDGRITVEDWRRLGKIEPVDPVIMEEPVAAEAPTLVEVISGEHQ